MPTQGFQNLLGIELLTVEPHAIKAQIRILPKHMNSGGVVHGGVLMAVADSLGAMGALQSLRGDQLTATLESKTNFIGTAREGIIRASCAPIHVGRQTSVWVTEIKSEDGRLVAVVTQTQLHFRS